MKTKSTPYKDGPRPDQDRIWLLVAGLTAVAAAGYLAGIRWPSYRVGIACMCFALGYAVTTWWLEYRKLQRLKLAQQRDRLADILRRNRSSERAFLEREAESLRKSHPRMEVEVVELGDTSLFVAASQLYYVSYEAGTYLLALELEMVWPDQDMTAKRVPKVRAYYTPMLDAPPDRKQGRVEITLGKLLGYHHGILDRAAVSAKAHMRHIKPNKTQP